MISPCLARRRKSSLKYDATSRQIEIYPIAGTRPRGRRADGSLDRDLDSRIELEMRTDHKELSEHLMLVDLARNDLLAFAHPAAATSPISPKLTVTLT